MDRTEILRIFGVLFLVFFIIGGGILLHKINEMERLIKKEKTEDLNNGSHKERQNESEQD